MSETYKIIYDQEALEEFVDWLPDSKGNEEFYFSLQARKKYASELTVETTEVAGFLSTKDMIIPNIQQLECAVGCYCDENLEIVSQESLVLYMTPNPRDMQRATFHGIELLASELHKDLIYRPDIQILNGLHKSTGYPVFVHLDIDIDRKFYDADKYEIETGHIWSLAVGIVGKKSISIIETKNGWHVLIEIKKVEPIVENWFKRIKVVLDVHLSGEIKTPVVGCCQGGYVPRFFKKE